MRTQARFPQPEPDRRYRPRRTRTQHNLEMIFAEKTSVRSMFCGQHSAADRSHLLIARLHTACRIARLASQGIPLNWSFSPSLT